MPVPKKTVLHLAGLARLKLTPGEIDRLSVELTRIIDYFERLKAVDTDHIKINERFDRAARMMHPDTGRTPLSTDEALKNAPETKDSYFVVPRVIE